MFDSLIDVMMKDLPAAYALLMLLLILLIHRMQRATKATNKLASTTRGIESNIVGFGFWKDNITKDMEEVKKTIDKHESQIRIIENTQNIELGKSLGK